MVPLHLASKNILKRNVINLKDWKPVNHPTPHFSFFKRKKNAPQESDDLVFFLRGRASLPLYIAGRKSGSTLPAHKELGVTQATREVCERAGPGGGHALAASRPGWWNRLLSIPKSSA